MAQEHTTEFCSSRQNWSQSPLSRLQSFRTTAKQRTDETFSWARDTLRLASYICLTSATPRLGCAKEQCSKGYSHGNGTASQVRSQPLASLSPRCCLPVPWEGRLTYAQVLEGSPDILTGLQKTLGIHSGHGRNTRHPHRALHTLKSFVRDGKHVFYVKGCAPPPVGCCPWRGGRVAS